MSASVQPFSHKEWIGMECEHVLNLIYRDYLKHCLEFPLETFPCVFNGYVGASFIMHTTSRLNQAS